MIRKPKGCRYSDPLLIDAWRKGRASSVVETKLRDARWSAGVAFLAGRKALVREQEEAWYQQRRKDALTKTTSKG
jgi:hypothetical protein